MIIKFSVFGHEIIFEMRKFLVLLSLLLYGVLAFFGFYDTRYQSIIRKVTKKFVKKVVKKILKIKR